MVSKILAIVALVALPFSLVLWYQSHSRPERYRCDLTPYKSLWVYLKDGICGLHVLSMPSPTSNRGDFRTPLKQDPPAITQSFMLNSKRTGSYRATWFVFPFWFATGLLTTIGAVPVVRGPARQWWRRWNGWCLECGYDLQGNRSGRCPECGVRFR